jgi:hypothetical protein
MTLPLRSYRERARFAPPWPLLAGAGLTYDFVHGLYTQKGKPRTLSGLLTVNRASPGYAADRAGNWPLFGNNVARRTDRGLLIEEARTNDIPNNSMQGAVVGAPGTRPTGWSLPPSSNGINSQIVGFGTLPSGQDYLDLRLSGTTTGTFFVFSFSQQGATGIPAVVGSVYTESFFAAVVGGSLANITTLNIDERWYTAAGAGISASDTPFVPTTDLTRFAAAATAPATTAFRAPSIALNFSSGVAIDVTLRIAWPQDELGTFETSPIRTTVAAVTRAADLATVTAAPSFGGSYTFGARGTPLAPATYPTSQVLLDLDDGTGNNRAHTSRIATTGAFGNILVVGGVQQTAPSSAGTWNRNTSAKIALALAAGDQAQSINGAAVTTSATTPIFVPTVITVGARQGGTQYFNGYVESIEIAPTARLSNTVLPGWGP